MQLQNKVAIVTGSSRGLGKQIAKVFAREGAAVMVTARAEETGELPGTIHQTVHEIEQAGGEAVAVRCDIGVEADVQRLVNIVMDRYGQVDIIVNNAVTRVPTKLIETTTSEMRRILEVNVLGPFMICKYAMPGMMERRRGNIINIKSTDSLQPRSVGNTAYKVSKAALTQFTAELALEVKEYGIAVNAFHGGGLITEGSAANQLRTRQLYGEMGVSKKFPKLYPPEVCDEPILYLATQTAATFTGQLVRRVDYGITWGPGISLPR